LDIWFCEQCQRHESLLGGYVKISMRATVLSLMFLLSVFVHLRAQSATWTKLSTTGGPTFGDQSVVYDAASNRAITFGGVTGTPCCTSYNDVWVLTNANGQGGAAVWNHLSPAAPDGAPLPRSFQSSVYDAANNRMIVFGGGQASTIGYFDPLFNDVWVLTNANGIGDTPTWIPITPSGTPPAAREGHGAVYDAADNLMIVFGGGNNGIMDVPNDLWVLTNANGLGGSPAWVQLAPTGQIPPPTERFAVGYDQGSDRMIMFGGCCYWNNSTYLLTNASGVRGTPAWTQITPSGTPPQIREVHAFGYDPSLNQLIFFGLGGAGVSYNDTWSLSSANNLGGTPTWKNLIPNDASGSPPLPFWAADPGAYDPGNARLMLIKAESDGQGGTFINPWVLALHKGLPRTIPYWAGQFTYAGSKYPFLMVGTNPYKGSATTSVPVEILPLDLTIGGMMFNGSDEVQAVEGSPLFASASFGTDQTQYGDAMQRAEFWNPVITKTSPDYHVLLGAPAVSPTVALKVPPSVGEVCTSAHGLNFGVVLRDWLQYVNLDDTILPKQNFDPGSLTIVLTHNVFLLENGPLPDCTQIKLLYGGYHWALPTKNNSQINTYLWGSYFDPGISVTGEDDVFFLSHEVAEWMNDPFVNLTQGTLKRNTVPNWLQPGSNPALCNSLLEVGDATEDLSPVFQVQGTSYHVTDVAGISWFAHQPNSMEEGNTKSIPSYSYTGELSSLPTTCSDTSSARQIH
jgi:hypothetical protein